MHIIINKDKYFLNQLHTKLENNQQLSSWELFELHYRMETMLIHDDFDALLVPNYLPHVNFMEHQVKAAQTVIHDMDGRAILADEVGLGKTIEAGLILKEYMLRKLVKKVLILVPSSLVPQWVEELHEKFHIPAVAFRKGYEWEQYDVVIASIDTAKQNKHQSHILDIEYDMVIVDEAHKIKNHKTKNHAMIRAIQKKYCLLLTATPVQNKLRELFNLVTVLKPGFLGTYESFKRKYRTENEIQSDKHLQKLIQQVMVRNARKDTLLHDVKRQVETVWLTFNEEEQKVYDSLSNIFQDSHTFSKITYLKELCSSREACYLSLEASDSKKYKDILENIAFLPHHVKAKKLVEIIQSLNGKKVIVFTEYRATQFYLQWYLAQENISSVPFRGGMKANRKTWMMELFQNNKQVLIATEAGGEGVNLQFCSHIINYDLPWNPMRLEQRIGRIHRYGQENDVHIYHFAIQHTIEEQIMHLLYKKIHMFEQVVGKLDDILTALNIDLDKEFSSIMETSDSVEEMEIKVNHLTEVINQAGREA